MPRDTAQHLAVRPATPADVPTLLRFIRELAAYERAADQVQATEADLLRDGFSLADDGSPLSTPARFRALIADWQPEPSAAPEPAGFALFFPSYSTWVGHHGLRLEDLYVTPALRGHGIGKALFRHLAQIALAEGCQRLEWDVLTWNAPSYRCLRTHRRHHAGRMADHEAQRRRTARCCVHLTCQLAILNM